MKKLLQHDTSRDLLVLLCITLVLGIYMVATTVVIAKDGVLYIERAQQLTTQFTKVLNANEPFGFPALIFGAHWLFTVSTESDSNIQWILSGQLCVFFCRFLAVGVLYFFGKALFDRRQAFWGILILIFLPYSAEMGTDVLRDWSHLLFLFAGLLFLYEGIQKERWGSFFAAGLLSGLGYLIRPECAQGMLYGTAFFVIGVMTAPRIIPAIRKNWFYVMLLAGFLMVFVPYTLYSKNVIPHKLEKLYEQSLDSDCTDTTPFIHAKSPVATASSSVSKELAGAFYNLFARFSENLMYYFALPAGLGFYLLFLKSSNRTRISLLLIGMFIGFYVLVLCLLYLNWGYISRRHVLPLTALFCFYIPWGIEAISQWLNHRISKNHENTGTLFTILMVIGIAVCLPKLYRPIGYDKAHYLVASEWIEEHTRPRAKFYTFDRRIPFYAKRHYRTYPDTQRFRVDFKQQYLITTAADGQLNIPLPPEMPLQATFPHEKKKQAVLIYKRPAKVTDPSASGPQK